MHTVATLSAHDADLALATIRAELGRRRKAAVIAVADRHGELLALHRMDGAGLPSITVAANKAWTAARLGETTGQVGRAAQTQGWSFAYYADPRYVGWDGGAPVQLAGQVLGAVAVSGLAPEEDLELALLGVQAVQDALTSVTGQAG